MKFPLGRKSLVAVGAAATAVAFWKARAKRRDREAREWESEISSAIDEGSSAAEKAPSGAGSERA